MKSVGDIRTTLEQHRQTLEEEYRVREIGIFGSYTKGQQTESSDVDILVDFAEPIGLFKFLELEEYLKVLLGVGVDLVSRKALKPRIGRHILEELVTL
ncbi:MAG: nucleotidyltransferase family protein [Dehalococcoidia bacterium]|nr:nucleotidyltransferase family protein [Dehalococcoidia bacterium]